MAVRPCPVSESGVEATSAAADEPGQGSALNVRGRLEWEGLTVEFVPTSLAPSSTRDVLLAWPGFPDRDPEKTHGTIDYEDAAMGRWRTRFWVDEEGHFNVQEIRWMMRPDGTVSKGDDAHPYRFHS
jgi:hypothetical protein